MEGQYYHVEDNRRNTHNQSNWCDLNFSDDDDEEVIFESDEE
jgi:hypothetical protein